MSSKGKIVIGSLLIASAICAAASSARDAVIDGPPGNKKNGGDDALSDVRNINVGMIENALKYQGRFSVRNASETPMRILEVRVSNNLKIVDPRKTSLAPGETADFHFAFSGKPMNGFFSETVSVLTDSPAAPVLKYVISGVVSKIETPALKNAYEFNDFGEIKAGDKVERYFSYKNDSNKLVKILSIKVPCGCTKVKLDNEVVNPGETIRFKVTFDSTGRGGAVTKSVYLVTDSQSLPIAKYVITGKVIAPIMGQGIAPAASRATTPKTPTSAFDRTYDFGSLSPEESVKHSFMFKNASGKPIKIIEARSTCDCLTAKPDKKELAPNDTLTVETVFHPENRLGDIRKHIFLTTDASTEPSVLLTLKGKIVKSR